MCYLAASGSFTDRRTLESWDMMTIGKAFSVAGDARWEP